MVSSTEIIVDRLVYTCFDMLHVFQNTVPMPTQRIFAVLGMALSLEIIIYGLSALALVCSTTSEKRFLCIANTYLQCLVGFSHRKSLLTDGLHLLWCGPRPPKHNTHAQATHKRLRCFVLFSRQASLLTNALKSLWYAPPSGKRYPCQVDGYLQYTIVNNA